jgi:hypothetical protein
MLNMLQFNRSSTGKEVVETFVERLKGKISKLKMKPHSTHTSPGISNPSKL